MDSCSLRVAVTAARLGARVLQPDCAGGNGGEQDRDSDTGRDLEGWSRRYLTTHCPSHTEGCRGVLLTVDAWNCNSENWEGQVVEVGCGMCLSLSESLWQESESLSES